ncbi:MAG: MarR family transcriptional regulator [Paracoccaceae bacterium]
MSNAHFLLERLARLSQAAGWAAGLNPAQRGALDYLSRANRFSRAPSHVADYLGTTRGTASQTLQALARKRLVEAEPDPADRRSVSYRVTADGRALLPRSALAAPLAALEDEDRARLERTLSALLAKMVGEGRTFGLCATCRHHRPGPFCALLDLALAAEEAGQICHEHRPV